MAYCLATVPGYEEVTASIRAYMVPILRETVLNSTDVFKLDLQECTRANVERFSADKDILFFMGHGATDKLTGTSQSEVVLDQDNIGITQGKVVYALSCLTADTLGPAAIAAGAKAYIGFTREYTLYMDGNLQPLSDPLARSSILPVMEIMRSLYAGKTVAQAVADGKNALQAEISRWQVIDAPESSFIISALQWNIDYLVVLGDMTATTSTQQITLTSVLKGVLLFQSLFYWMCFVLPSISP